jgi:hypothetical protein
MFGREPRPAGPSPRLQQRRAVHPKRSEAGNIRPEEFRRRVKTQGSLPTEDAALVLLFGLVASGQIRLRRVDGLRQIPAMLSQRRRSAA